VAVIEHDPVAVVEIVEPETVQSPVAAYLIEPVPEPPEAVMDVVCLNSTELDAKTAVSDA
jgi:hypothetical protein